jgi:uncharacterized protein DUF1015
MRSFENMGIKLPEILVPDTEKTDISKWSVIACDQFTAATDYWDDVKKITENYYSSVNLILPECYLKNISIDDELTKINNNMEIYLESGFLRKLDKGFVLVERETPFTPSRKGLVIAVDLEKYDYSEFADSLIRPTEKTVVDRLPPRIKIRENASMDLPHILFLLDDTQNTVIEKLYSEREKFEKLYDFKLMKDGGKIRGWHITGDSTMSELEKAFTSLSKKHKTLFAVGDGNHSLAAAKEVWNIIKQKPGIPSDHPARYALVELVNINSNGIGFEPIHRVIFNTDTDALLKELKISIGCRIEDIPRSEVKTPEDSDTIIYVTEKGCGKITLKSEENLLATEKIQTFLDSYPEGRGDNLDYIHGEKDLTDLAEKKGNIGFLLPDISKKTFFKRIAEKGVYPRKTFSIGESIEKRYYLESRKLR